ncbi:uncharacterized protein LOC143320670 [Chaetodon auriga]|uniref:uncharacterized protein LOC143320670 n=1 Tax=Chaetodon auriga TaxID=39042 RepID=UPI004032FA4B
MCDTSNKSWIVGCTGVQNGYPHAGCGESVNDETNNDCLQELERINKEIETVRHEVEQEQRRLSRYRTVQADSRNTGPAVPVSKSETAGTNVDTSSYGLSLCTDFTQTNSRARKYVVDNSKPRTDLEYDPLSNFSADLRSYSSSGKEQKVKNGQGLKRMRNSVPCDQKKPVTSQAQLSRLPLPEPLDDLNEDDVLIIDIPPSPDKKRRRVQKPVDSGAGKSFQDKVVESKEVKIATVLLNSPPLCFKNAKACMVTTVQENRAYSNCCAESNQGRFNHEHYENEGCKDILINRSVIDLTGCLEDLGGKRQKITHIQATETVTEKSPEPASQSATKDQQDQNWNNLEEEKEENTFQVELPKCDLPHRIEKMNPLQPYDFPPKNSLFYKDPVAVSVSPCRQDTKQAQKTELPAQDRVSNQWSYATCAPSMLPHSQTTSSKIPVEMLGKTAVNHVPPESYQEPAEPVSGSSQGLALHSSLASSLTNRAESSSASTEQLLERVDDAVIITDSSSEDELNYSEIELSDSDPMEECYRIFMTANEEDKGNDKQPDVSVGAVTVEKPEINIQPQAFPGKTRVAHEAKHTEQPMAKSRPQPQVLVPLRSPAVSGFASQSSITSNIQHVQQRASMLAASVKGGQAFLSSTCQRRSETQGAPSPVAQTPENLQSAPVQNAYMNCVPLGNAMIKVGNNLHLILPEGAFPLPVTCSSSPVTSVLTPIRQVQMRAVAVNQTYYSPTGTPVQRCRSAAPVLIPALARKPSMTSACALANSSSAASTTPHTAAHAAVKPVPTKRKLKPQCEAPKDKVPHEIRQRYVNMFTEEFLKTTASANDAFDKALAEERTVYNRSVNKLRYQSVAVNALKRLKNQSAAAAKDENEVNAQQFKGHIPLNQKRFKGNDDMAFYESLKDYILTEEKLIESNYPVQHPEKPGCAVLFADNKKGNPEALKRICCRCGATYFVSQTGKHVRQEECNYHYGKGVKNKVPGGMETRYSCCEGVMGAPGCQVFKLHVHDSLSLDGFVSTVPRTVSNTSCPGVFSLDCEMCYTIHGLELSRVTLVNSSLEVIYDTFVRPDNEVIDYNTRFSGISEEDVKGTHTTLREVQETLLSFISADTIVIGHSLEMDLCALKLLHGVVVDTSVVFPHRLGPPHKLTLNSLTADYLRRIIQESVCGHDTAEDATACMELMLWKVKEDGKLKK